MAEDPSALIGLPAATCSARRSARSGWPRSARPRRSSSCRRSPPRSSCSPRTRRSTASRSCRRCSAATATCRASSPTAATGSCSPTASCCSRSSPALLIVAFDAEVTRLIQLYILGVFLSFTLSQAGMVRHWAAARALPRRKLRPSTRSARVVTGLVFVIVLVTKFAEGAWIVVLAAPLLFFAMKAVARHYDEVGDAARARRGRRRSAGRRPRRRAGVEPARADAARARVRARPSGYASLRAVKVSDDGADDPLAGGVGAARRPGAARGARVALPRDRAADRALRAPPAARAPRRRDRRRDPGVRRRALVAARCCTTRPRCG